MSCFMVDPEVMQDIENSLVYLLMNPKDDNLTLSSFMPSWYHTDVCNMEDTDNKIYIRELVLSFWKLNTQSRSTAYAHHNEPGDAYIIHYKSWVRNKADQDAFDSIPFIDNISLYKQLDCLKYQCDSYGCAYGAGGLKGFNLEWANATYAKLVDVSNALANYIVRKQNEVAYSEASWN